MRLSNTFPRYKTGFTRWLYILIASTSISFNVESKHPPTPHPNILVIYTDDQRWDSLSLAGHPFLKTPNIDRIGKEGALFNQSFVTAPSCSPSRASFLSGQYSHTHRARGMADYTDISMRMQTFPRILHQSGYRTGYFGKWDLGNDPQPRPGFDRWVSLAGQSRYYDPTLNIDGKTENANGYIADVLTDYALDFIDQSSEKPFCMIVAHKGPHSPFTPAVRHRELYEKDPIPWRVNVYDDVSDKAILTRPLPDWPKVGPGTRPGGDQVRNQLRTLVAIDENVGRLLDKLETRGELDNTIVVYTSDNGYFWGEHGLSGNRAAYDEALRVPLLVRYPSMINAGTVSEALVASIDIAPTLLTMAGLETHPEMHGKSLTPVFGADRSLDEGFRKVLFADYVQDPTQPRIPTWQAVRTKFWKYIHYPTLVGADELYKLNYDSHEMENRYNTPDEEFVDIVSELKKEMVEIMETTDHSGRMFKVEGLLIDQWQVQNAKNYEEARGSSRATMLGDGSFNSGFLILKPDGSRFQLPDIDKRKVLAFLESETRAKDLSVKAYFYEEGQVLRLIELTPVFDRPDAIAKERNGVIAIEAEHANSSEGYRTLAIESVSGGFVVQVDEEVTHSGGNLTFEFEVETAGRWHVWIRTRAMHHRENGIRLMIDGKYATPPPGHPLEGSENIFIRKNTSHDVWNWDPRWKPTHEQEQNGLRHAGPVTIDLTAGTHTLSILKRLRERPLIDKIALTRSPYMPGGFGPEN